MNRKLIIYSRNSFLEKITRMEKYGGVWNLNNSSAVRYLAYLRSMAIQLLLKTRAFIENGAGLLYSNPLKAAGAILFLATAINIAASLLFKKEISLFGWFLRVVFIFAGIAALFCNTDWQAIKNNSKILNLMKNTR